MSTSDQHILCVDDQPDTCDLVSVILGLEGYRMTAAATMAEALQLAKHHRFDLYLLDNRLPDGSGEELCAKLREHDADTPIVIYTADAYPATRQRYLDSCIQAFVTKPSDPEVLTQTIIDLLAKSRKPQNHPEH